MSEKFFMKTISAKLEQNIEDQSLENLHWEKMFFLLIDFKKNNGHAFGPLNPHENIFLWKWIEEQRKQANFLSADRMQRLNDLGFQWTKYDIAWEKNFIKLLEFKKEFGHTNVPPSYSENPSLGKWVIKLRLRKNSLKSYRIKRLEEIGFYWNPYDKKWNEGFLKLVEFQKKYGHCNVPEGFKDDPKLAVWVFRQRIRRHLLDNDRREKLIDLGFEFTTKADHLNEMLEALKEFKNRTGQCSKGFTDQKLNAWGLRQRKLKHKLSKDKIKRLEEIGFVWDLRQSEWEKNFLKLQEFKKIHKHCNVPARYLKDRSLAMWVGNQRKNKDTIDSERKKMLEELGFEWSLKVSKQAA